MIYLDYLRPISEFVRTDDEDQPDLILETENGLFFQGMWILLAVISLCIVCSLNQKLRNK